MQSFLVPYGVAFLVFLVIDAIWLSTAGRHIYVPEIGHLLLDRPNFFVAFLFYALFVAGLTWFVIMPGREGQSLLAAAITGGFFGLVCYATYDLTNLSTVKGFTTKIALIDMAWGSVLSASVTAVTIFLLSLRGQTAG